ncbi:MAG: hypothetical protein A3D65_03060 [Candidatus Lloydbacteria bacterium RIFCSPHIGHO2_02_FULL_50_13]|uniref:Transcription regulator TrmB N-terminal domain-containing protein n=1 Tax=Candidatus Lloydbacteria bacterium RIFCSPHIGHO2_02_FULL_50_13 TaxID=1798661 RepID=A0A1G2D7N8_9BACT|nr:MAG: hypothetical protein A3D65_03060 [Candidatus Lloydbacteria bacterium RIFCSPHIGHO2_02_FULL_50_13]
MTDVNTSLGLLGFSKTNIAVFLALLRLKRGNVSQIGRAAKLPRTTIYTALEILKERGLITPVKVGNHKEWEALPPSRLEGELKRGLASVHETIPELEKIYGMVGETDVGAVVKVYETRAGLLHAYNEILKLRRGERVLTIEGQASIEAKYTSMPVQLIIDWQTKFRKSGIILDAIAGEGALTTLEKAPVKVREAHIGRRVITTILPRSLINFEGDLLIFRHITLITIPRKNIAIVIEEPYITEMFRHLHGVIASFGRKIDLNEWFRQSLKK